MMDDIERYARLMGMKRSEVLQVVPGDGGARVRTSDGAWTHVSDGTFTLVDAPEVTLERDSGVTELASGGIVEGRTYLVGETGPELTEAPAASKPAPKRRRRS